MLRQLGVRIAAAASQDRSGGAAAGRRWQSHGECELPHTRNRVCTL